MRVAAALLFGLLWWWLRRARSAWARSDRVRSAADRIDFHGSRLAHTGAPPGNGPRHASILGLVRRNSADQHRLSLRLHVTWARLSGLTLRRPNYLALDQSAGVVFSRETALEVRRRSEVLLPVTDPTWKILSGIRRRAAKFKDNAPTRPLTAASLGQVCGDPKLGFVISPENVGFDALSSYSRGRMEGLESL